MDQTPNSANITTASSTSSATTDSTNPTQPSGVLFREIHKNAWLKRLPTSEKRTGAFPKKGDRVWVVFCVHDDVDAFLETYVDQKVAVTHKPDWFVKLNNCIHVSPTICGQEDEFEFVITLTSDLVRLTAPSWDTMMEWVETIRSKLREMKILSPRENIYSKMPEARLPLAPTRDPNSPLPLPPAGPSSLLPGIEPALPSDHSLSSSSSSSPSSVSTLGSSSSSDSSDENSHPPTHHHRFNMHRNTQQVENTQSLQQVLGTSSQAAQYDDVSLEIGSSTTSLYITQSEPQLYARSANSSAVMPLIGTSDNVTVIQVSNQEPARSLDTPAVFNFNFVEETLPSVSTQTSNEGDEVEINEAYYTPPLTPAVSTVSSTAVVPTFSSTPLLSTATTVTPTFPVTPIPTSSTNLPSRRVELSPHNGTSESPRATSNHYECVFLPRNPVEGEQRRRRAPVRGEGERERRLQPAPHPYRQQGPPAGNVEVVSLSRLTLRDQQVIQLRKEMLHPGGIRLQLRRKDCTGSIALVDAFGGVWISGWKQREHPMLYNALHIGDQLISIAGVLVQNASDAQKLVRSATSLYVEFVIRRVPFGRVFAIRRDTDGQNLGIVQDGNTAVIRDVAPDGPAARHGLTAKVQSCDGLSLTPWVLTEVNGRPLNLFFKDNEVRDRLNAVGREISILVQPFDLVKQLKKQLKSLRGYKDYIVQ